MKISTHLCAINVFLIAMAAASVYADQNIPHGGSAGVIDFSAEWLEKGDLSVAAQLQPENCQTLAQGLDKVFKGLSAKRRKAIVQVMQGRYSDKNFVAGLSAPQAMWAIRAAIGMRSSNYVRLVLNGNNNWPTLQVGQWEQLAKELTSLDKEGGEHLRFLGDQLHEKLQGSPAPILRKDLQATLQLICYVAEPSSDECKSYLIGRLWEQYGSQVEIAPELTETEYVLLATALIRLKAVEEVSALLSDERWKSITLKGKNDLVEELGRLRSAADSLRSKMAAHIVQSWRKAPGLPVRREEVLIALEMAHCLWDRIPATQRESFARLIWNKFGGLEDLNDAEYLFLSKSIICLGGEQVKSLLWSNRWILLPTKYQRRLAYELDRLGDDSKSLIRLQYEEAYLRPNTILPGEFAAPMKLGRWLASDLATWKKQSWSELLREKVLIDGHFVETLKKEDIPPVMSMLLTLGDSQIINVVSTWIDQNWGEITSCMITQLLAGIPDEAPAAIHATMARHAARFLLDDSKFRDMPLAETSDIVKTVAKNLKFSEKARLAPQLLRCYAPDETAMASLSPQELKSLFDIMARLGDAVAAKTLLKSNSTWRDGNISDIAGLYSAAHSLGELGLDVRLLLCDHFAKKYLSGSKPLKGKDIKDFENALKHIYTGVPSDRQAVLTHRLEQVYADQEFVESLSGDEACNAVRAAVSIQNAGGAATILRHNQNWRSLKVGQLLSLARDLQKLGTGGESAYELFVLHAETAVGNARSTKDLSALAWMIDSIQGMLSGERKEMWAKRLIHGLDSEEGGIKGLSEKHFEKLANVLMKLDNTNELYKLFQSNDCWKSFSLEKTAKLAGDLKQFGEKGQLVRNLILDQAEKTWFHKMDMIPIEDIPHLRNLIIAVEDDASSAQKVRWRQTLKKAITAEEVFPTVTASAFIAFEDIQRRLGDENPVEVLFQWMSVSSEWKSEGLSDLLIYIRWRNDNIFRRKSDGIKRLAEHLYLRCSGSDKATRQITLRAWQIASFRLADFFTKKQRDVLGQRLLSAFMGDMQKYGELKSKSIGMLIKSWQELGRHDLVSLVGEIHGIAGDDLGRLRTDRYADSVCGLVLMQVIAGEAEDRPHIWNLGRWYIYEKMDRLSPRTLSLLDMLIAIENIDSAFVMTVITDLMRRTQEISEAAPQLRQRLRVFKLRESVRNASQPIQQLFHKGEACHANGDIVAATEAFFKIVNEEDCPPDISDGVYRRIINLLLQQRTDVAALQRYVPRLQHTETEFDVEAWNLTCRALFRYVAAADQAERVAVWKQGITDLAVADVVMLDKTFEDLDKLTKYLAADDAHLALQILTDLLICIPDANSMRRLQWRRVAAFIATRNWQDAEAAAALDVVLAAAHHQAIEATIDRYMQVLRSSGATDRKVAASVNALLLANGPEAEPTAQERFVDGALRKAIAEQNERQLSGSHPRQKMYISLLCGRPAEAASLARNQLACCIDSCEAKKMLADIYVLLAVADGNLAHANRFAAGLENHSAESLGGDSLAGTDQMLSILISPGPHDNHLSEKAFAHWPAETRSDVACNYLEAFRIQLITSAQQAAGSGNKDVSIRLQALLVTSAYTEKNASRVLDEIIDAHRKQMGPDDVRRILRAMISFLPAEQHQRITLHKIANLAFEQEFYSDCLSVLDEAEALTTIDTSEQHFPIALLRASALLKMEEYETADDLLESMAKWDGADEDKAQCLFIKACLRLRQGRLQEGKSILRSVLDRYPETSMATKAGQLIIAVE